MEKGPNQQTVDIIYVHFQNDNSINDFFDNSKERLFALQLKSSVQSAMYQVTEENPSTEFNLLIKLKQNRGWGMNGMNDGKYYF